MFAKALTSGGDTSVGEVETYSVGARPKVPHNDRVVNKAELRALQQQQEELSTMIEKQQEEIKAHARRPRNDRQAQESLPVRDEDRTPFPNWKLLYPRTQRSTCQKKERSRKTASTKRERRWDSDLEGEVNEVITEVTQSYGERSPSWRSWEGLLLIKVNWAAASRRWGHVKPWWWRVCGRRWSVTSYRTERALGRKSGLGYRIAVTDPRAWLQLRRFKPGKYNQDVDEDSSDKEVSRSHRRSHSPDGGLPIHGAEATHGRYVPWIYRGGAFLKEPFCSERNLCKGISNLFKLIHLLYQEVRDSQGAYTEHLCYGCWLSRDGHSSSE